MFFIYKVTISPLDSSRKTAYNDKHMGNEIWAGNQNGDEEYVRHEGMSEQVAGMMLEAHGMMVSVEDAMRLCPPFRGMVESILDVPGGEDILELAIPKMAEKALTPLDDAKKNSSNQPNPILY